MNTPPPALDVTFWTALASATMVLAFIKSAANGAVRTGYNLIRRASDELDRIEQTQGEVEQLGKKLDSLSDRTDGIRGDIRELGRELDKVKRVQRASLKYNNGQFDAEQALADLAPEEQTLERYHNNDKENN